MYLRQYYYSIMFLVLFLFIGVHAQTCGPGSYLASSVCTPCTKGKYQPNPESSECLECQSGKYSNQIGAEKCTDCPEGYFSSDTGLDICTECPYGFEQPYVSSIDCTICADNTYKKDTECQNCAAGKYLEPGYRKPTDLRIPKLCLQQKASIQGVGYPVGCAGAVWAGSAHILSSTYCLGEHPTLIDFNEYYRTCCDWTEGACVEKYSDEDFAATDNEALEYSTEYIGDGYCLPDSVSEGNNSTGTTFENCKKRCAYTIGCNVFAWMDANDDSRVSTSQCIINTDSTCLDSADASNDYPWKRFKMIKI